MPAEVLKGGGSPDPSLLQPLQGQVILEPGYDPEETEGGLYVLMDSRQRYPQIGYCIASASAEIEVGDWCLINVESSDVARTYQRVFALHLKDWGTELFEPDVEPAVVEAVESYRSNPSTADKQIRTSNLKGEHLSFLASDVLSYEWTTTDTAGFRLMYPLHVRMWWDSRGRLYYFVHEDHILATIPDDSQ